MREDIQQSQVKPPFLPRKMPPGRKYTLVLDLDETLVHFDENTEGLYQRPNVVDFLKLMARFYEVVIFTAGMQDYAEWALEQIGGDLPIARATITHRLYR